MGKYRKKPVVIEATQWFKNGDHPEVHCHRYPSKLHCMHCGVVMDLHGWVNTLEGGHSACPNDWIITGVKGEHYPCKPDIFEQTYEKVEGE